MPLRKIRATIIALIGITTVLVIPVSAQQFPDKPPKNDFFLDEAQLLSPENKKELNVLANQLLRDEQVPLIVVTIPSLLTYQAAHLSIEDYAAELFDHWGIGSEERDYGMLLLVSKGDRKARIELGSAWEHRYDTQAQKVMDSLIITQFKRGNFTQGILDGARGLDAMARGLALPKPTAPWWSLPLMLATGALVIGIAVSLFRSGKTGWGWAFIGAVLALLFFIARNSTRGGSAGAFRGGSSGGGGASGSW